jgi:hypothetical protein
VFKGKILDKNFGQSSSDRMFIAANFRNRETPEVPGMPGNALCRFEFLEIVIRIAREKFGHLKEAISLSLERLLEDYMKPNIEPDNNQRWREQHLWTIEVEDLFRCNLEPL